MQCKACRWMMVYQNASQRLLEMNRKIKQVVVVGGGEG